MADMNYNLILKLSDGTEINAGSFVVPQGPQGPKGDTGEKGATGAKGDSGSVPLYAATIADCTDTTKLYLLPDGYLYAYTESTSVQIVTEQIEGTDDDPFMDNTRLSSSGTPTTDTTVYAGYVTTPYIDLQAYPVPFTLHLKGGVFLPTASDSYTRMCTYTADKAKITCNQIVNTGVDSLLNVPESDVTVESDGGATIYFAQAVKTNNNSSVKYARFSGKGTAATANIYVTYEAEVTGAQWINTGMKYSPTLTAEEKVEIAEQAAELIDSQLLSIIGDGEIL